ncbi:unnamed protein product [Rotaria sordida]|uniref:HAT C-terminal dimerisation domain-containing protein n=2 Tax=Rotaria sordida TaxID=392033 RepID=A0A819YR29_9BILA|nr:unnamed protein product [Rotaria sordida]
MLDHLGLSYCGISVHHTDRDFRLFNFILGCYPYDAESHSAQHLRAFVDQKLNEYKLCLDNSKYVVTDNEAKMLSAFRENCTRIGCSDHYINRQLKHAFESQQIHVSKTVIENVNCDAIQGLFFTIKNIVSSVRRSHKQQILSKKLQSYSDTRFNGALYMLDVFRELFDELPAVLISSKLIDAYQEIDKQTLDDVCVFLHPFEEVIESLSENKKPCLHRVIPLKQYLLNKCDSFQGDQTSHRIKVAWIITNEHRLATILHPKFKKFESCADEKRAAIDVLKNEFDVHYDANLDSINSLSPSTTTSTSMMKLASASSSHASIKCASSVRKGILSQCFDQQPNGLISSTNRYQEVDDYLNRDFYFKEDEEQDGDIDVLDFWRKQQNSFPTLSLIARKFFAIPASNTTVERLFSSSKLSVGERRTNLGGEKLNQLMFLQKNLVRLKERRQVNKVPTKRSISDQVSVMSEHPSETIVKKAREDNTHSSDDEGGNIEWC